MTRQGQAAAGTDLRAAAARLLGAQRSGQPCPPVRHLLPDGGLATGYAVQGMVNAAREAGGARRTGRKVGLTATAVQAQLGVDQPDFGVLFDDMACSQRAPIDPRRLLQPRIEAEVAFVLGADLDRPPAELTGPIVRTAAVSVMPALEIVDSRIHGWDITLVDTIADNASCGLYVLGDPVPLAGQDLAAVIMRMTDDTGAEVSAGTGAACLGDPVAALKWLARTVAGLGAPLRAGEGVLSGALGPMVPVSAGRSYTATLDGLGAVRASFKERA
jgi:2-keto-4-pentenoate hydratase